MKTIWVVLLAALVALPVWAAESPETSLYSVALKWHDQGGADFQLSDLAGKPVVLSLAYTKCSTACPLTMQRLKHIHDRLGAASQDAAFVIVSLDPSNDTPAALAEFKRHYNLSGDEWHLLTGRETDVRKLAVLLSYSYQAQEEASEIVHSNKIFVLDRAGKVAGELEGLASDIEHIVRLVRSAS